MTEYIAEGFVVLGCFGELIADRVEKRWGEGRSKRLERWSTVILILALIVSLKALIRTNQLSGFVIGSLGDKAEKADAKAQTALENAGHAEKVAGDSTQAAKNAGSSASSALVTARQARTELDAFHEEWNGDLRIVRERVQYIGRPRILADNLGPTADESPRRADILELRKYSNVRVIIQTTPYDGNGEAKALAEQIAYLVSNAGWGTPQIMPPEANENVPPGVIVLTNIHERFPYAPLEQRPSAPTKTEAAAAALVTVLALDLGPNENTPLPGVYRTYEIFGEVTSMLNRFGFNPQNDAMLILVGPKPINDSWPIEFLRGPTPQPKDKNGAGKIARLPKLN